MILLPSLIGGYFPFCICFCGYTRREGKFEHMGSFFFFFSFFFPLYFGIAVSPGKDSSIYSYHVAKKGNK